MAEIKAIETAYNGYKFRSRLEARWAVFFDALGVEYRYETEGYEVEWGDKKYRYLPDFYLPKFDIYAEVKGTDDALFADSEKIGHMIDYNSSPIAKGLLILGPIPSPTNFEWGNIPMFSMLSWDRGVKHDLATFQTHPWGDVSLLTSGEAILRAVFAIDESDCQSGAIPSTASVECRGSHQCLRAIDKGSEWFDALQRACSAARQARFEHGETPKAKR